MRGFIAGLICGLSLSGGVWAYHTDGMTPDQTFQMLPGGIMMDVTPYDSNAAARREYERQQRQHQPC
jgi:hypothetical protein